MSKIIVTVSCFLLLVCVVLGTKTLSWTRETDASQTRPPVRSAAILGGIDDTLVMFGGFIECFDVSVPGCENVFFSDTWEFDLDSNTWTQSNSALSPGARAFMATDNWDRGDSVVIYGGIKYNTFLTEFTFYDDMWAYNVYTHQWTLIAQNNAGPGPRVGAGIAIDRNTLYLFGGLDNTFTSHNDLWTFDLQTGIWTLISPDTTSPNVPAHRYIFAFELNRPKGDTIYLHGGNFSPAGSGEQRQDSWKYDIDSNTWTEITGDFPGRIHQAAGARNNEFIMAFGDINDNVNECKTNQLSGGQNPTDTVFQYNDNQNEWEQLFINNGPGPLKRVSSTVVGKRLYIYGGYNFICNPDGQGGFPVYNPDIYSFKF